MKKVPQNNNYWGKKMFIYLEAIDLYKFRVGKFRLYIDPLSGYNKTYKLFQPCLYVYRVHTCVLSHY